MDWSSLVPSPELVLKIGGVIFWARLLVNELLRTAKWAHKKYACFIVWRLKWKNEFEASKAAVDKPA
jgi:hypothetical protein